MTRSIDLNKLKRKRLCCACVGEDYLSEEISKKGRLARCAYCGGKAKTYTLGVIADRIEAAFEDHYTRTLDYPDLWESTLLSDHESNFVWERHGEPVVDVIADAACISSGAAQDLQTILEARHFDFDEAAMGNETEFGGDSYYEQRTPSDAHWQQQWSEFEERLKKQARYFSKDAAEHLASVFDRIEQMRSSDGRPLVISAGPDTALKTLYRARVFQSGEKLLKALCSPDAELGSPPVEAAGAGRMNARGISVFYGANEPAVAIAEVRPPVGSKVAVARFEVTRALRLLDLTALRTVHETGSVFDPDFARRIGRAMFLRSLSERITRPVMPDDEAFDYLATQAIADYLANMHDPPIDGIVYPSVQVAGQSLNIVLFHGAARVERLALPDGSQIEARDGYDTDEGWEEDYSVSVKIPEPRGGSAPLPKTRPVFDPLNDELPLRRIDRDTREASLRIDLASVTVHSVKKVTFTTRPFPVRRHQTTRRPSSLVPPAAPGEAADDLAEGF